MATSGSGSVWRNNAPSDSRPSSALDALTWNDVVGEFTNFVMEGSMPLRRTRKTPTLLVNLVRSAVRSNAGSTGTSPFVRGARSPRAATECFACQVKHREGHGDQACAPSPRLFVPGLGRAARCDCHTKTTSGGTKCCACHATKWCDGNCDQTRAPRTARLPQVLPELLQALCLPSGARA